MNKIKKWFDDNKIEYTESSRNKCKYITIITEPDCVWVNGFGEEMHYDKKITVMQDLSYKTYALLKTDGYNKTLALCKSTKQVDIIDELKEVFNEGI